MILYMILQLIIVPLGCFALGNFDTTGLVMAYYLVGGMNALAALMLGLTRDDKVWPAMYIAMVSLVMTIIIPLDVKVF